MIKQINYDLENKLGLKKDEFKLAGVLILFFFTMFSRFRRMLSLWFMLLALGGAHVEPQVGIVEIAGVL